MMDSVLLGEQFPVLNNDCHAHEAVE